MRWRKKKKGKQKKSESLDRLVFGRRNLKRVDDVVPRGGPPNNRKWPNLLLHGRDRVKRQIEFGTSFYRTRRFNSPCGFENAKCSREIKTRLLFMWMEYENFLFLVDLYKFAKIFVKSLIFYTLPFFYVCNKFDCILSLFFIRKYNKKKFLFSY